MFAERPLKLSPPPFVICTVCEPGFDPPGTAAKSRLEEDSEMLGAFWSVNAIEIVCGELEATVEATEIVAP